MSRALSIALVAVLAGCAFLLRPAAILGGSTGFVVVRGTSMLPTLHNGDLVVSRAHDRYSVGDVLAYHVPQGQLGQGRLVIHRVVAVAPDGSLTLRGDNNPQADPWHPRQADVGGTEWLRVPKAGGMLLLLRTPAVAAMLGALLAIWVVARREPDAVLSPALTAPLTRLGSQRRFPWEGDPHRSAFRPGGPRRLGRRRHLHPRDPGPNPAR